MLTLKSILNLLGLLIASAILTVAKADINIISDRSDFHIKPLITMFTEQTGIKVNSVFVSEGTLYNRLASNNENYDLAISTDISTLNMLKKKGFTKAIDFSYIDKKDQLNKKFIDKDKHFIATSYRVRDIVYNTDKVNPNDIKDYDYLADPVNKGKVCMRPLLHVYNVALVSEILADKGEEYTRKWIKGVVNNLAVEPSGNDRKQGELVSKGICNVSLMNTYYYGLMMTNNKQRKFTTNIQLYFPEQDYKGSYVLVSGIALLKNESNTEHEFGISNNSTEAEQFINFMLSTQAQHFISYENFEYPVIDIEKLPVMVEGFGEGQTGIIKGKAKLNFIDFDKISDYHELAVKILTEQQTNIK